MVNTHNDRKRFDAAKDWRLKFGKFKGQTLNQAAESDEGLRWLDWALTLDDLHDDFREALTSFLRYEVVARDVETALASRQGGQKSTPPWRQ